MKLIAHRSLFYCGILCLLVIGSACSNTKDQIVSDRITTLTDDLQRIAPSVVMIEYGSPIKKGTGVIVGESGDSVAYVLTADHIAAGFINQRCTIRYYTSYVRATNVRHTGVLLQRDDGSDIALIKVSGLPGGQRLATINKSAKINFDEQVSTIGHPGQSGQWLASQGKIVSAIDNDYGLQMTVRRGNSGGGVYSRGNLIGLMQQTAVGIGEAEVSARATKASVFVPVLDGRLDALEAAGLLDRRYKKAWSMHWSGYAAAGVLAVWGGIRAGLAFTKPKPLRDPPKPE